MRDVVRARRRWIISVGSFLGVAASLLLPTPGPAMAAAPSNHVEPARRAEVAVAQGRGAQAGVHAVSAPKVINAGALAANKRRVAESAGKSSATVSSGSPAGTLDRGELPQMSGWSPRSATAQPSSSPKTVVFGAANGMTAADENGSETPSDSTGAIGPNHYVEMVNNRIAVYNRSLQPVGSPIPTETFANVVGGCASDPQVQWDPAINLWVYALLVVPCNSTQTNSWLNVGWSTSADPSDLVAGWCHLNVYPQGNPSTDVFDFPKLGHYNGYLVVGGNVYNATGTYLNSAVVTLQLPATPASTCGFGPNSFVTNVSGVAPKLWTPVPVDIKSSSSVGYILGTEDVAAATSTTLYILTVDATGHVLTPAATLNVRNYSAPANATQPAGQPIDTADGRLTQAVGLVDPSQSGVFRNDLAIWTQHTVYDSTFSNQAGATVRWYEILAPIPSSVPDGYPAQVGTIWGGPGSFLFNAAISPTMTGNEAVINYNAVFPTGTSVTGVLARAASRFSFTPNGLMTNFIALGQSSSTDADASCSPGPCRWGDYAGASPDPVNVRSVWGTSAVVGSRPNPCVGPCAQWVTGNFQLAPFSPTAGYNILTSFGGIYSFGNARYFGNLIDHGYPGPAIGLGEMPRGDGYQILTTFGGIYSFGSAAGHYFGNLIDHGYAGTAVAIAMTPSGNGYSILTSSGAIYTFGDALYFGNLLDHGYPGPAVSIAYTPDGFGYTILTASGGIYSFGNAAYFGNLIDHGYPGPAVSLAYTGSGEGYEILTRSGGIYTFGNGRYFGNLIDHGYPGPAVALANTPA